MTSKLSASNGSTGSASTSATRAKRGPFSSHAANSSIAARSPCATISTAQVNGSWQAVGANYRIEPSVDGSKISPQLNLDEVPEVEATADAVMFNSQVQDEGANIGVIQLLAFPDIRVVEDKRTVAHEALALINEQLWLGHFELWSNSGTILFRHGMLLGNDAQLPLDLAETLIESAIDECERFYPVFQFVLWGGKTPAEALAASLIETRGEA